MSLFYHLDWNLAFANRKPDGTIAINWNDPITEGLEFFTMIQDGKLVDLVTGDTGVLSGNGVVESQRLITSYAGAGLATWNNRPTIQSAGRTLMTRTMPTSDNGQSFYYFLAAKGGTEYDNILATYTPVANSLQITWNPSSGLIRTTSGYAPYNEFHVYAGSCAADGQAVNSKLYKDGVLYTGSYHDTSNGTPATLNGGEIYMSGRPSGSRYLNGRQEFAVIWNRQLSDAEVLRASNNINYLVESGY